MMLRTCLRSTFALAALAMLMAPPVFAEGEGRAVGVNPDAVARINSRDRVLVVGADVSVGETVITGPRGQVQIVFADDTRLAVGPGSSLKIETYLMRGNGTADRLAVNALAGSFRFITGHSPKSAYQINTPTATIGVRGTKFDIFVGRGETRVLLYEGAVQMCGSGGKCVQLSDQCELGVSGGGSVDFFDRDNPERLPLSANFYFARFQAALLSAFRINGATRCLAQTSAPTNDSITDGMPGSDEDSRGSGSSTGGSSTGGSSTGGSSTGPSNNT